MQFPSLNLVPVLTFSHSIFAVDLGFAVSGRLLRHMLVYRCSDDMISSSGLGISHYTYKRD